MHGFPFIFYMYSLRPETGYWFVFSLISPGTRPHAYHNSLHFTQCNNRSWQNLFSVRNLSLVYAFSKRDCERGERGVAEISPSHLKIQPCFPRDVITDFLFSSHVCFETRSSLPFVLTRNKFCAYLNFRYEGCIWEYAAESTSTRKVSKTAAYIYGCQK